MYSESQTTPVGYEWLRTHLDLDPMPHFCKSYIVQRGMRKTEIHEGRRQEFYPQKYQPEQTFAGHLEFAFKYEGIHLHLLKHLFQIWPQQDLVAYLEAKPTGKNSRRIWFLYEAFTQHQLPLNDLTKIAYCDLLDPKHYFTIEGPRSKRHRVHANWLGTPYFCPVVRRTPELQANIAKQLSARMQREVQSVSTEMMQRAVQYLYTKETKSSFAIERQTPDQKRSSRFIELLKRAGQSCELNETRLTELQNAIVDQRFAEKGFRSIQNYVGETAFIGKEIVHFAPPRPEDIRQLMAGLDTCSQLLSKSQIDPVVGAAIISFAFVYLHPFEDGNGRIHRFLIHDFLAEKQFTPPGIIFPISAALLNNMSEYDAALEVFSQPFMTKIDYSLNQNGELFVNEDTSDYFRFMDLTHQATALYAFLEKTIDNEFVQELDFLQKYDHARQAMRTVIDMPDRQVDLFIRLVAQNQGKLGKNKRDRFFSSLNDQEIGDLEECVQDAFEM